MQNVKKNQSIGMISEKNKEKGEKEILALKLKRLPDF